MDVNSPEMKSKIIEAVSALERATKKYEAANTERNELAAKLRTLIGYTGDKTSDIAAIQQAADVRIGQIHRIELKDY